MFVEQKNFLVDIPDDADELYCSCLCFRWKLLFLEQTNNAKKNKSYLDTEIAADRLPPHSRFRSWPADGITIDMLKIVIGLTFYFGVIKKDKVMWRSLFNAFFT